MKTQQAQRHYSACFRSANLEGAMGKKKKTSVSSWRLTLPLPSAHENKDLQHHPNYPLCFAEDGFSVCPKASPKMPLRLTDLIKQF